MTDSIDVSRAPRGEIAASALVNAVAKIGDLAEHHYLEIKGPIDLASKTTKAKIAKYILGSSNRMPEKAAATFEGCGVMIIGVSSSGIEGVPLIEVMEISKGVQPYLGAAGPRWDIVWVPIEGSANQVLVIVVDPPTYGQGPFICRAHGDGVTNGRVYIRGDGETREATAEELELLINRGMVTKTPDVDFDVRVLGDVRPITVDEDQTLEAYIEKTREYLLDALPTRKARPLTASMLQELSPAFTALNSMPGYFQTPEDRTDEQYRAQIETWEQHFRAKWPKAVKKLAGRLLPSLAIQITNKTPTFFHDVEVAVHLKGSVIGIAYYGAASRLSWSDLDLPSPPRRWGPRPTIPYATSLLMPDLAHNSYPISSPPPSRLGWKNTESIELTLDAGEIRPLARQIFDEEELALLVTDPDVDHVDGTWTITARDFNEVFSGSFIIPMGEPINVTQVINGILTPDGEDIEPDADLED